MVLTVCSQHYLKSEIYNFFFQDGWDAEIVIGAIKPSVDLQNMETVIVELHKLRDSKTLRGKSKDTYYYAIKPFSSCSLIYVTYMM